MKWKKPKDPEHLSVRLTRPFAWLPVLCKDENGEDEYVWLERYTRIEQYSYTHWQLDSRYSISNIEHPRLVKRLELALDNLVWHHEYDLREGKIGAARFLSHPTLTAQAVVLTPENRLATVEIKVVPSK